MQTVEEVREAALNLSVVDRELLVNDLLHSLEPDPAAVSNAKDWTLELLRRSDAFHAGTEPARDWRESVADVRRQFESRRQP